MSFCVASWQVSQITYAAVFENDHMFYMLNTQVLSHEEKNKEKEKIKRGKKLSG